MPGQFGGKPGRSLKMNPPASARPKQEFYRPLQVGEIASRRRTGFGKYLRRVVRHAAIGLLDCQSDWNSLARVAGGLAKNSIGQHRGSKRPIQNRRDKGSNQRQAVVGVYHSSAVLAKPGPAEQASHGGFSPNPLKFQLSY